MTPHRALAVEHDLEVIDVISEAMESMGHEFDTARSQPRMLLSPDANRR